MKVLIAGGSGFIGEHVRHAFLAKGHQVLVLSRNPKKEHEVYWDPKLGKIDEESCRSTEILINLCGAPIDGGRWTKKRKQELEESRVGTTQALLGMSTNFPSLKQFISASGINAYGYDDGTVSHHEEDPFGDDYLSQLVKKWEEAADQFSGKVSVVTKMRIAVVFNKEAGALKKMAKPIQLGFGSALGSGKQIMPWVSVEDLARQFVHVAEHSLSGAYNTNSGCVSNEELTSTLAVYYKKKIWMPKVPPFVLHLLFGEMAEMLLKGSRASNEKLAESGFTWLHSSVEDVLAQ